MFDVNAHFRAPADAVAARALALAWDGDWAASALARRSPGVAIVDGRGIAPWHDLEILEQLLTGRAADAASSGREVAVDDDGSVFAVSQVLTAALAVASDDVIQAAGRSWHAALRRIYREHGPVGGVLANLAALAREAVPLEEQLCCWINC